MPRKTVNDKVEIQVRHPVPYIINAMYNSLRYTADEIVKMEYGDDEMINYSKFCVVYYDENYLPLRRKNSRRDLFDYQPKSGTKVAYDYAVKKKKHIINTLII